MLLARGAPAAARDVATPTPIAFTPTAANPLLRLSVKCAGIPVSSGPSDGNGSEAS